MSLLALLVFIWLGISFRHVDVVLGSWQRGVRCRFTVYRYSTAWVIQMKVPSYIKANYSGIFSSRASRRSVIFLASTVAR